MTDYDAIVVGSGAGGLAASVRIARNDHSVLLLEATPGLGGCLRPFEKAGYTFDMGLHYVGELGEGEKFWEALNELGLLDRIEFIELDPEAIDRYVFPDFELRLCKGKQRFKEQLIQLFPKEASGIEKYFGIYEKVTRASESFMDIEARPLQLLGWVVRNPVMLRYGRVPYQALLDTVTSDIRLQTALAAPWFDFLLPPERAAVSYGVGTWYHYLSGGYYPRGGSRALRDAFVDELEQRGAEVRTSAGASSIDRRNEGFLVTFAGGKQATSRVVVSNVNPVVTFGQLVNPNLVPSGVAKKAKGLRPSASVFGLLIGTDLDLPALGVGSGNLVPYAGYDVNKIFAATMAADSPRVSDCFFVNSPSVRDPAAGLAPPGHHSLEVLAGASYAAFERWADLAAADRGEEYEALVAELSDQLVSTLERFIPQLSRHLEFVEVITPLTLARGIGLVEGGIYGPEVTPDQMGPARFPDGRCGIDGLFLAGAGTKGSSVFYSTLSGVQAGRKAVSYLTSQ
jgi:phytoene dehydrogenase-like protein